MIFLSFPWVTEHYPSILHAAVIFDIVKGACHKKLLTGIIRKTWKKCKQEQKAEENWGKVISNVFANIHQMACFFFRKKNEE